MQREAVDSSNIASMGYDTEHMVLEVEFRNGSIYHYVEVSPDLWVAMQEAPSAGQFLNQSIKPIHDFGTGEFEPDADESAEADADEAEVAEPG